ncbi:Major Facilitator Superfamily [Rhizoctonia solani]|uniref:Major Facilitator Superfamily n=1 Tax=Rhizoctonia solani TaxID=456999 RepID=A0A8H7IJX0_9AGAM|nr:Major Facilitator Superfamily [Rhizoctonia solani]
MSHPYERDVVLRHVGDQHPDEDHVSNSDAHSEVNSDPELDAKHTLVSWKENDPENPRNLSRLRKWTITLISSALCPMEEFQVSEEVVNLTVTLFVVGFGIVFTLPSALAPNIGCLIVSRALAGLASSAPMTNVGGTLADIWMWKIVVPRWRYSRRPFLWGRVLVIDRRLHRRDYRMALDLLGLFIFVGVGCSSAQRDGNPTLKSESELQHVSLAEKGLNAGEIGLTFIGVMIGIFCAMLLLPLQEKAYRKVCEKRGVVPEARLPLMMFGSILLPFGLFIFAWTSMSHVHWIGTAIAGAPFGAAMVAVYISANSYIIDTYQRYTASAVAAKTFLRSLVGATVPLWVNQMYAGMTPQWASTLLAFLAILAMPIPFVFFYVSANQEVRYYELMVFSPAQYGDKIRARSTKAN